MHNCFDDDMVGFGARPSPYPIYGTDRGQRERSPFTRGDQEFNPQSYERVGLTHPDTLNQHTQAQELQYRASDPNSHRIEGPTLDPGRVLTNPGRQRAPCLISSIFAPGAFGHPQAIEDSCPDPAVYHSHGQYTLAPGDTLHTIPKQLLEFDYQALSQQDIADRARLSVRKAMYGR